MLVGADHSSVAVPVVALRYRLEQRRLLGERPALRGEHCQPRVGRHRDSRGQQGVVAAAPPRQCSHGSDRFAWHPARQVEVTHGALEDPRLLRVIYMEHAHIEIDIEILHESGQYICNIALMH